MKNILILVHDIYEELELHYPRLRLIEAGCQVTVVGEEKGAIYRGKYGYPCTADESFVSTDPANYDALVIPGGYAPDRIRRFTAALNLVSEIHEQNKPIAFICHGGWVPISARILSGKTVTGYVAIKDDLENAGAKYVDKEVVVDGNLISSRTPTDLPAFMRELIKKIS